MNNIIEIPKIGIKGTILSWEVVNQDGSIDRACYKPSCNMILNSGLDMIASQYDTIGAFLALKYFAIGTGVALPVETDTTLGTESHREIADYAPWDVDSYSVTGSDPYYVTRQRGVQTTFGLLNGTYTEIGFSPTVTANATLFSKFRLVDEDGDPTSIAISSIQQLRLKYTITIELLPATPTVYTTTITGIAGDFTYTACWQKCSSFELVLSGISGTSSLYVNPQFSIRETAYTFLDIGTAVTFNTGNYKSNTYTTEAYVPGSYTVYKNITYAVTDAVWVNKAISLYSNKYGGGAASDSLWVVAFDSGNYIDKPNTYILTLRFKFSWGRS